MTKVWMIYGAYGYSGQLLAQAAVDSGLVPLISGRNADKVNALADELDLPRRVFALDDADTTAGQLEHVDLLVNCAGPFSRTAKPLIEACLSAKTHYFDITGEIDVFEFAHGESVSARAREAGIVICPGIGFDVVPTDCLAATLAQAMPDASRLALGFATAGVMSPGTAKTTVEGMAIGNRHRREGEIRTCATSTRQIDFGGGTRTAMNIAWGDVSTAFYTTGIGNIDVYVPAKPKTLRAMKMARWMRPLLATGLVQRWLKRRVENRVHGPDADLRAKLRTLVWGEVRNPKGDRLQARLETPNGYDLTVHAPLAIVRHGLESGFETAGSTTPAVLMGADFVTSLPGCSEISLLRDL